MKVEADSVQIFGKYLKELIKNTVKTQTEFLRQVKVSKTYLVQMMNSQIKPPAPERQFEIVEKLRLKDEDAYEFFDKAAAERDELPADVERFVSTNQEVIAILRRANKKGLRITVGGNENGQ